MCRNLSSLLFITPFSYFTCSYTHISCSVLSFLVSSFFPFYFLCRPHFILTNIIGRGGSWKRQKKSFARWRIVKRPYHERGEKNRSRPNLIKTLVAIGQWLVRTHIYPTYIHECMYERIWYLHDSKENVGILRTHRRTAPRSK